MALSGGLTISNGYFREVFDTIFRNTVSKNMQKRVHKKAEHLPIEDYEDASLNDLLTCAGEKFFYGDVLGFLMQGLYVVQILVSIAMTGFLVWSYDPILVLPFVGMMGTQILGIFSNRKKIKMDLALIPIQRKRQVYKEYLTKYENMKEIRSLGVHRVFCEKWKKALQEAISYEERVTRNVYLLRFAEDAIKRLTIVAAYLLCVYLVDRHMVGIGQFGAMILLMQQFQNSSSELVERIQEVHASVIHVQNGLAYFELPQEQRNKRLEDSLHRITLEQVSYRYPAANRFAVADIQLELKKNEIYAVVGKNGSGKTTLSRLICGLFTPTEGTVRFDGVLAEEIENASLFGRTTVALQDFSRYAMTVRENILLGDVKRRTSDKEFMELAKSMKVTFLSKEGVVNLDTELGVEYGGMELSGGQWQQLAVLRAKYKDADLVILDEPTAVLDPLKEAELFEVFQEMCQGKIGVIITHRLGMCALADKIIHMEQGYITEVGSHREVMERNEGYARAFRKQAQMYGSM